MSNFPLPGTVHLEFVTHFDDDRITLSVQVDLEESASGCFSVGLITDYYEHPRVEQYRINDFDLPTTLAEKFALVLYNALAPHLTDPSMGGTAVTWTEPDLRKWVTTAFDHADSTALITAISNRCTPTGKVFSGPGSIRVRVE